MLRYLTILVLVIILQPITAISQDQYKVVCTGFYNLENLFDTINDPKKLDEEFLPNGDKLYNSATYIDKLHNLSTVISRLGIDITPDGLAILGIAEIENQKVVEDLISQPALRNRNYKIVHYDSPDFRGVDVGLIYQPKYFTVLSSKSIKLPIFDNDSMPRPTRDILLVNGLLDGDTIHIMVNHWPSRRGGDTATEPLRMRGAAICKAVKDSLIALNPAAKVIIMGDLNDNPSDRALVETLSAKSKISKVGPGDMYNTMYKFYKDGNGTLAYKDSWSLFDQIILSPGLLDKDGPGYHFYKAEVYRDKSITEQTGQYRGYPLRTYSGNQYIHGYSDHFPVFILLVQKVNHVNK